MPIFDTTKCGRRVCVETPLDDVLTGWIVNDREDLDLAGTFQVLSDEDGSRVKVTGWNCAVTITGNL